MLPVGYHLFCSLFSAHLTLHTYTVLCTFAFKNVPLQTCLCSLTSAHLPLRTVLCTMSSALYPLPAALYSLALAHLPLHAFFCTLPLHTFPAHCAICILCYAHRAMHTFTMHTCDLHTVLHTVLCTLSSACFACMFTVQSWLWLPTPPLSVTLNTSAILATSHLAVTKTVTIHTAHCIMSVDLRVIYFFFNIFLGIFLFFSYYIQHCFICRPSDSTVPMDAGIEPRTVATGALAVRRSNH